LWRGPEGVAHGCREGRACRNATWTGPGLTWWMSFAAVGMLLAATTHALLALGVVDLRSNGGALHG